nr:MAG TPA: hypothetical protein [Bacteriophage sp.]
MKQSCTLFLCKIYNNYFLYVRDMVYINQYSCCYISNSSMY